MADETDPGRALTLQVFARLSVQIDQALTALEGDRPDCAALTKQGQTIATLARATRATAAMIARPRAQTETSDEEADMDEIEDPTDPVELERRYADLSGRLDRLRGLIERKRAQGHSRQAEADRGLGPLQSEAERPSASG